MTASISWQDPARQAAFSDWLNALPTAYNVQAATVRDASADASFRRYLRVDGAVAATQTPCTYIIMDAPPEHENCAAFAQVADLMAQAHIPAARVLEWDEARGFMLLPDLGDTTMLSAIDPTDEPIQFTPSNESAAYAYFLQAIELLVQWQLSSKEGVLPAYDAAVLQREVNLFPEWYVAQHRQYALQDAQQATLQTVFDTLIEANLRAPKVYVHRDYMPRNFMVQDSGQLAVLDFQDALYGPITYDIASLMKDAFVSWDEEFVLDITIRYWERARKAGLPVGDDFGAFYKQVEWMALQRHVKVAGIFARLTLRDGKPKYLADTPRFIHYICTTAGRYRELKPLMHLVHAIEGTDTETAFSFGRM